MDLNLDSIKGLIGKKTVAQAEDGMIDVSAKKAAPDWKKIIRPLNKILGKSSYNNEKVLGVDISPHYVRICQMRNSYDQWILNNLASSCIETQFRNYDIHGNPDLYVENLKELIKKSKITVKNVAFSVPTSSSIIRILNIPAMDDDDFAQAAAIGSIWESYVTLDGSASEYAIFYKILRRHESDGTIVEAEIMAADEGIPEDQSVIISETPENISDAVTSQENPAPAENIPATVEEFPAETMAVTNPTITIQARTVEAPVAETPAPAEEISVPETVEPAPVETPSAEQIEEPAPAAETMENPTSVEDLPPVEEVTAEMAAEMVEPLQEEAPAIATMDVLFVATKLTEIYTYSDIIRRAGLNPILADVRCLALKHAFESNPKNLENISEPYAFMEFGPDDNYIFVIDGNNTSIYNISVSEEDVGAIIASVPDIASVQMFIQNYAAQASQILQSHNDQTGSKIRNIFVSSSAPLHVNDASSAPLIKTFVETIPPMLGEYEVTECNFCKHIVVPEKFAKQVNAEGNIAAWASTVGIATRKLDVFDYEENEGVDPISRVNLLPESTIDKKNKRMSVMSLIATAAVCLLFVYGIADSYYGQTSTAMQYKNDLAGLATVESKHSNIVSEAQKLTLLMNQVKSLDGIKSDLPSNQKNILMAYDHIQKSIPEGIWLKEVNYLSSNKIEITGNSVSDQSILEFTKRLNDGKEFSRVVLKTMETKEKDDNAVPNPMLGSDRRVKIFTLEGTVSADAAAGIEVLTSEVKNGS